MPICPECYVRIDLRPIWKLAGPNGLNFIGDRFGLSCPNCSHQLRIQQLRPVLLTICILGAAVAGTCFAGTRLRSATVEEARLIIPTLLIGLFLLSFIQRRAVIPLTTLRRARPEERLVLPLEWDTMPISKIRLSHGIPSPELGPNWRCFSCGEASPSHFEVCWKCQKERPRAGA